MPVPHDPHPPFQEYSQPERLVSAAWLSSHLGLKGLRVVESDEETLLYDIGHIPGAVRIHWHQDLSDAVTRDVIDAEAFAELMRNKGIDRDDTVVVYGDKSNWWAAYTVWVFELFEHADVRLLDGGREAWMAEERDTSFVVPDYPETDYPVVERVDEPHRAFLPDVLSLAQNSSNPDRPAAASLIDVRSLEEYTGNSFHAPGNYHPSLALRSGHIPGARHVSTTAVVHPNLSFRSRAELEEVFADFPIDSPVVTYCNLGDRSAHAWFVLKFLLGYPEVRNYDGAWAEWGNLIRVPIAVGNSPVGEVEKE